MNHRKIVALGLLAAAWAGVVSAGPAPGSLRVSRTTTEVELSWGPGGAPYGVYRALVPDSVIAAPNLLATTEDTSYAEPLSGISEPLQFYLIGGAPPCIGDADCNDFNDCTLDRCVAGEGCRYDVEPAAGLGTEVHLAGNPLAQYPFFEHVRAFNEDRSVRIGIDPARFPQIVGETCDVWVVETRDAAEWCADDGLIDVRGAPDTRTFASPSSIQGNTFPLIAAFQLNADAGTGLGVGYDVVLDCDRDARLGTGDWVDGSGHEAGLYLVHDLTQAGPLATETFDEIGPEADWCQFLPFGGTDDLRVYYPTLLEGIDFEGVFPLVVISHGNGHCFDWYDHLGTHLASYGYIVLGHDNATEPGIESASTTTLEFTDRILAEQAVLGGGVLDGHIDSSRITWIGHSRGGEGVVRAYDRLRDEGYAPPNGTYTIDDIVLVSSIAPTDFYGPDRSNPHEVPYHLMYGAADGDVCGCPDLEIAHSFNLFERATGNRQSAYIHGADHNDFNCCGFDDFEGPSGTAIGRPEAQRIQTATYLALLKRHVEGNVPAKDYLWRQYESLRPIGVDPEVVVDHEYREAPPRRALVLDDYQTESDSGTSSAGTAVTFDVENLTEGRLDDGNSTFTWNTNDPMNGMTRGRTSDTTRGVVFDYAGTTAFYQIEIPTGQRDMNLFTFLSLRAAQGTRHPNTTADLEELTFRVVLVDGGGSQSAINVGAYGGGVEQPYARTGSGSGFGWQNEFETIRIRLTDFLNKNFSLDFDDIAAIRLEFGAGAGSPEGRVALDDIELTLD